MYTCFVLCNSRGDVLELRNTSGTVYARYEYDAWGNPTHIYDAAGNENTTPSSLAVQNPIRYRGYYYDSESGLYYLQSRYYDPVTCRFLNADSQLNTQEGLSGYNLFLYCGNNPIVYSDPNGHSLLVVVGLGILFLGLVFGLSSDNIANNSTNNNLQYSTNKDPIDPQKPPNPESGYIPPKKNPNPGKVKNPNGAGKGWPSKNGGVWVPNNSQDGGPGWTVQFPNGKHEHRYPDGHIRTHKISFSSSNIANAIIGGSIMLGTGIGIIIVLADDTTGVGVMDNVSLLPLFRTFMQGAKIIAG